MDAFRILQHRLRSLFRKDKLDLDLDDELRAHIELATEENIARGMNPPQARKAALQHFGGPTQIKEIYRRQRGFPLFDQAAQDLRFAFRQLYRSPGFAATAILTLALGLGANTAIFSLVNALLLRPLPVPHANELAIVGMDRTDAEQRVYNFNAPMLRALERHSDVFASLAGVTENLVPVRGANGPNGTQEQSVTLVSGQYFTMMQTAPLMGRYLLPSDDVPHGSSHGLAVVISETFWRRSLNSDQNAIGRKLVIANAPFTIVGVMPRSFTGNDPMRRPDIFLPLSSEPFVDAPYDMTAAGFHANWINVMARRRGGVTLEAANAALQAATMPLIAEAGAEPGWIADARASHLRLTAEPGSRGYSYLRDGFKKPLVTLLCLCAAVLLLACLNLMSLLTARAAARERELATRLAIGATRGRLVQQLMVEAFLMTILGTLLGLMLAPLVSRSLAGLLLSRNFADGWIDTRLDVRVFAFSALMTMVAGLLVGLLPALRATAKDPGEQIKHGSNARPAEERRQFLPRALLGLEVALALILVIGAGLLATSLSRLYRTGLGFDAKGLITLQLDMDKQALQGPSLMRWYEDFAQALKRQPGVRAMSYQNIILLAGNTTTNEAGSALSHGTHQVYVNEVGPEYFAAMRIPLLAGREFHWQDGPKAGLKIILNQSAARLLFPGRSAVGEVVTNIGDHPREVIAVVGDAKYASISEVAPATIYLPITQTTDEISSYSAVVRMDGDPAPLAAAVRELIGKMAPEVPVPVMTTMQRQVDVSLTTERMMAMLSIFFAACALLVTGIGLYGTLAYSTARRTSEIGIRMALGAHRMQVVMLVFRENLWSTAIGALAGLGIALAGARVLASFLYGTSVHDPWVLTGAVASLALIASAASLLPAIRAARIEPMEALRAE